MANPTNSPDPGEPYQRKLGDAVGRKENRKLSARRNRSRSVWFGLGMSGLIGWSVALPTVTAIAVGIWCDRHWETPFSCTLSFLFIGLVIGCVIAWYWVKRELAAANQNDTRNHSSSE